MPIWLVFTLPPSPGTFEYDAAKRALSKDITKIYIRIGLPAFYVVVNFVKLSPRDVWVRGEPKTGNPFIRTLFDHIAVRLQDKNLAHKRTADAIEKALMPHISNKGYDWEFHVDETDGGFGASMEWFLSHLGATRRSGGRRRTNQQCRAALIEILH
jgi:hypothetical protein